MNTNTSLQSYEIEITINPEDIDQLGHVNNVVYIRWVQEAAVAHWYAAATKQQKETLLWVVRRHEIDYKRPVFEDDSIIARTWVGTAESRSFERHTELKRKSDGKVVARARTLWCPIDSETKKPVDVGEDVYETFAVGTT